MMDDICLHKSSLKASLNIIEQYVLSSDKPLRASFKEWRNRRSIDQNSLSHMWYSEIAEQASKRDGDYTFTLDEVKKKLKETFLGYEKVETKDLITGEEKVEQRLRKTSELDTGDMHFYLSQVEVWAIDRGFKVTIPRKSEYNELKNRQVA